MCLRYELFGVPDLIEFLREMRPDLQYKDYPPFSANIALTEFAPIIFHQKFLRLQPARFGLVPSWAKMPDARLGNARSDTVDKLPSFRDLLPRRRCLVPATAFYEWHLEPGEKKKTPYRIKTDDTVFFFAGLWDYWAEKELVSFTILTTEPNELISQLHDRMPVILPIENHANWLDPEFQDVSQLKSYLAPYPAEKMSYQPYDRYVSNAINKDPNLILPVGEPVRVAK